MAGTDAAIANTRHDSAYLPSSTHAKPDNKHTAQQHTHRHTTVQAGLCWVTFSPHQREQHNPHPTPLNAVVVIPVPYSLPAVNTVPMVQNPATMESSMPRRFVGRYSVYSVNTVGMEPPTPMPAITRHPANMGQPVVTGHRSKAQARFATGVCVVDGSFKKHKSNSEMAETVLGHPWNRAWLHTIHRRGDKQGTTHVYYTLILTVPVANAERMANTALMIREISKHGFRPILSATEPATRPPSSMPTNTDADSTPGRGTMDSAYIMSNPGGTVQWLWA